MAKKKTKKDDRNKENLILLAVVSVVLVGLIALLLLGSKLDLQERDISGGAIASSSGISGLSAMGYAYMPYTDPDPGIYGEPIEVILYSRTEGAIIVYTTDGSDPEGNSMVYTAPIYVYDDMDIKARAYKEGMQPSSIMLARFFIRA